MMATAVLEEPGQLGLFGEIEAAEKQGILGPADVPTACLARKKALGFSPEMPMNWRERIESDPQTSYGGLRIRGTGIPVSVVLDNLAAHVDVQEVLTSYPSLSAEDVRACVAWAAECSHATDAKASPEPDVERLEPPAEGESAPREPMLYDLLMLGPDVGEDSDFERKRHPPREQPEWDT